MCACALLTPGEFDLSFSCLPPAAGSGDSQPAQAFFDKIMSATGCTILWPSRLKIGARSKKDPNVKMIGLPEAVEKAKAMMLKDLDTKVGVGI